MSSSPEELILALRRELVWHRLALITLVALVIVGSVWASQSTRYWDPLYARQVVVIDRRQPVRGSAACSVSVLARA